jgi:hypothetical protein
VQIADAEDPVFYNAAAGIEWRPDQANWSGSGVTVTTSSTFGIVKAANNEPRFDHNPTSPFACKGLLIEESRTNALLYSGALVVGTGWYANVIPSTTSIVDGLGPDGNNAYEVAEIANTGPHNLFNTGGTGTTGATSVVSGTTYTGSIFIKKVAGSVDWIQLSYSSVGFGFGQYANFNISNGTIGNSVASSPKIQDAGNGWYRCVISVVATATTTASSNLFLTFTNNADTTTRLPSYTGSTSNKVLAAMAQFEAGSFATSYIPTVASSVVRSADVCSITGSAFTGFYNPVAGSVFTDIIFNAPTVSGVAQRNWELASATTLNSSRAFRGVSGLVRFRNTSGGITDVSVDTDAIPPSQQTKQSFGLIGNDFAFYSSGSQVGIDTSCSMPVGLNAFYIGSNSPVAGGGSHLNGTISSLRYYKKRLSNAKLQALTA